MNWLAMAQLFVQLLPVLGEAVQTVEKVEGMSQADAIKAVADHNTPGKPNAPALAPEAGK